MKNSRPTRLILISAAAVILFSAGVLTGANQYKAPNSIVHIVTVKWKPDSTAQQQKEAIDGVRTMASEIPGIKTIWLKTLKVQPSGYDAVFAIEFENQAAFDRYADHPAHRAWEKVYFPVRQQSTTHDVTN